MMQQITNLPWIDQLQAMPEQAAKMLAVLQGVAPAMCGILPEMQQRTVIDAYHDDGDDLDIPYTMMLLLAVPLSVFEKEYHALTQDGYQIRSDVGGWKNLHCPNCGCNIGTSPMYQQRSGEGKWLGIERSFNICLGCFHVTEWVQQRYPTVTGAA